MTETPNPKCPRCRCYWTPDETDIKSSGLYCKTCKKCRENGNKYKQENQDKYKEINKQYYQENQDKIKQYNKQYKKIYYQNIIKTNLKLYLIKLQRGQIRRCFNNSKLDKSKHSIEYLGCNIETFLEHINKKIEYFNNFIATDEIMTLDNIHIDHIKPISVFNLDDEDEFLNCCHYTNLQPLLIKDNLEKYNKWTDKDEEYWNNNIKDNIEYTEIYLIK